MMGLFIDAQGALCFWVFFIKFCMFDFIDWNSNCVYLLSALIKDTNLSEVDGIVFEFLILGLVNIAVYLKYI